MCQHISNVHHRCDEVSSSWPASIGYQLLAADSEDVWTARSFVIRRIESRFSRPQVSETESAIIDTNLEHHLASSDIARYITRKLLLVHRMRNLVLVPTLCYRQKFFRTVKITKKKSKCLLSSHGATSFPRLILPKLCRSCPRAGHIAYGCLCNTRAL